LGHAVQQAAKLHQPAEHPRQLLRRLLRRRHDLVQVRELVDVSIHAAYNEGIARTPAKGAFSMSDKTTTAYSYIRFSTPEQAQGDSLRRQQEKAEEYCRRRGWAMDTTLTLRDLGMSAFKGANALNGNLATFLEAIERRKVTPGSVLIVESVDRICRQGIDEGYEII